MARTKENPRYNVMSLRASDEEEKLLLAAAEKSAQQNVAKFLLAAGLEKAQEIMGAAYARD